MSITSRRFSLSLVPAAIAAVGMLALPPLAMSQTLGGASGPVGDAGQAEKCDAPKGTLAVVEPQDVVATLAKTDEVIYDGEERDGFMKVETGSGTAWVKAIMMRKQ